MAASRSVTGSQIFLYAAGAGGNGKGATNLLTNPVYTDGNGNFSLTNDYKACSTSTTQVYLVASGGNSRPGRHGEQ